MCRLYGFRANEPTKVECTLVRAQNALLVQSRSDLRGWSHSDGWGIAYYQDSELLIERRETAAFQDQGFSVAAERAYAETVLAHVRRSTVGGPALDNTHPFSQPPWVFAHNGTVRAMQELRPRLLREIEEAIDERPEGTTDSETVFLWLLAGMVKQGLDISRPMGDSKRLVGILAAAVLTIEERCLAAGAEKPARLNFMLTDGHSLVASRWRNSLHWVARVGVHDCEICGIPHIRHDPSKEYHAVVVASEPISHEEWEEVPEGSIIAIDPDIEARVTPI